MKRHSVYLDEEEEPYLAFEEGDDPLVYQQQMDTFIIPSENEAFLRHIQATSAFLDRIYTMLYEREWRKKRESEGNPLSFLMNNVESDDDEGEMQDTLLETLRLDRVCDVLFRWHTDIVARGETMTGLYAINYFLTWGSYVRAFHLFICLDEAKLEVYATKKVREHAYCQIVNQRENIFITEECFIDYRVSLLWNSMRIILPSLYNDPYSRPMRSYIYSLFFRYGDLLSLQQEEDEEHMLDDIYNNPLFVTFHSIPQLMGLDADEADAQQDAEKRRLHSNRAQTEEEEEEEEDEDDAAAMLEEFDAYKKIRIPANKSYSINNEFLYQGEGLFYYQLRRLRLSDDLIRYHGSQAEKRITINYGKLNRLEFVKLMTEKWSVAMAAISCDTYLRQPLMEQYTAKRIDMHLYHGERERYKRQFPASTCESRDVLTGVRPQAMNFISDTQNTVLRDMFIAFKNAYLLLMDKQFSSSQTGDYEKEAIENGLLYWSTVRLEQETQLLTKLGTCLYFGLHKIPNHNMMSEAFILEEMVTLQHIEDYAFLKRRTGGTSKVWPVFIKLMRFYYVIDTKSNKIFKSLFFVESYFVWLALCNHCGLFNKKESAIHPELLTTLKKLNTMIHF